MWPGRWFQRLNHRAKTISRELTVPLVQTLGAASTAQPTLAAAGRGALHCGRRLANRLGGLDALDLRRRALFVS